MLEIYKDILDVKEGIIVHQVNCMGVMGAGLAKKIRDKWPSVYREYRSVQWHPGQIQLVKIYENLYVCNLAGQKTYGNSKNIRYTIYEALECGLKKVDEFAFDNGLEIYIPYGMGCGLEKGDWNIVKEIIDGVIPHAIICRL